MLSQPSKLQYFVALAMVSACANTSSTEEEDNGTETSVAQTGSCESAVECTGNETVRDQSDLDALYSCHNITGDLVFEDIDDMETLELPCLMWVEGNLEFFSLESLTSIDGLSSIQSVGGDLNIVASDSLTQIGLSSLLQIDGDLQIAGNDSLETLGGMSSLSSVDGDVWIDGNDNLSSLVGLSELADIDGSLYIVEHETLTQIDGFPKLLTIGGDLSIQHNHVLKEVAPLPELMSVGQDVHFEYNQELQTIDGLSGMWSVGGDLLFSLNFELLDIHGLQGINTFDGSVTIENSDITSLQGLYGVSSVHNITLSSNYSLCESAVDEFLSMVTVTGSMAFSSLDEGC